MSAEDKNTLPPDHDLRAMRFLGQLKSLQRNYPYLDIQAMDLLKEAVKMDMESWHLLSEDVRQICGEVSNFARELSQHQSVVGISVEGNESLPIAQFLDQAEDLAKEYGGTSRDRYLHEPTTLGQITSEVWEDEDPNTPLPARGGMNIDFFERPKEDL